MAYPKMKACPYCDRDDALEVFTYENGSRHVECVRCDYLGPACTSIRHAIRHHNIERDERAATHRAAQAANGSPAGRAALEERE